MTIEKRVDDDGTTSTHWQTCPRCSQPIVEQESFRQHWQSCPHNPEAGQ
jgi:hypothetical protein